MMRKWILRLTCTFLLLTLSFSVPIVSQKNVSTIDLFMTMFLSIKAAEAEINSNTTNSTVAVITAEESTCVGRCGTVIFGLICIALLPLILGVGIAALPFVLIIGIIIAILRYVFTGVEP